MLLETRELSFTYPNNNTPALCGVSLSVREGEFVTLCGASGCGKSTLLRLLKPALAPRGKLGGAVFFGGEELSALSERSAAREIGFVAQNPEAQLVTDRVWHELAFSLESVGAPSGEIRRRVAECAEYFGLERLFESETASLSGGEKQLVALASVMALKPRLLLLDEPTSQLDPIAAREFIDTAVRLSRELGIAVLIAEHRLEELLPVSDRAVVMDSGRIIADCKPEELLRSLPEGHRMREALPAAARIFALSGERGITPLSVREGRANAAVRTYLTAHCPEERPLPKLSEKPVISAKELWVSYGKDKPDALKNASVSLFGGEIYALLGGNGSGKTTLLKTLYGMVKPLGGRIVGKNARMAFLPQNPAALFAEESVLAELCRVLPEEQARGQLLRFGISEELFSRDPLDLSGGEQQRAALALLLAQNPEVLLLDEPTKGLDAFAKRSLSQLLRGAADSGCAVLAVTHDTEFAALCADRCGLLFNGEVVSEAKPAEFFSDNFFYTTPLCRLSKGIAERWF